MRTKLIVILCLLTVALVACEPEQVVVEVTRVVTETVVERIEVPVEVTRIVTQVQEVVVTATSEPVSTIEVQPTDAVSGAFDQTPTAPAQPTPDSTISGTGIVINQENAAQLGLLNVLKDDDFRHFSDLAYSPDGNLLLVGYISDIVTYDAETLSEVRRYDATEGWPILRISPNGQLLAVTYEELSSGRKDVELRHIQDGSAMFILDGHFGYVRDMEFSPDGQILITGDEESLDLNDASLWFWRVDDGSLITKVENLQTIESLAYSPSGDLVATGDNEGDIQIWFADATPLGSVGPEENEVLNLAFSPDGQTLASSARGSQVVHLWNVADRTLVLTLETDTWPYDPSAIVFSPDGSVLASGHQDGTIKVWRVTDGALLTTLTTEGEGIKSLAFHPDGLALASGSVDGSIRLWSVAQH